MDKIYIKTPSRATSTVSTSSSASTTHSNRPWVSSASANRTESTPNQSPSRQFFRAKDLKVKPGSNHVAYNSPKLRTQKSQDFSNITTRVKHRSSISDLRNSAQQQQNQPKQSPATVSVPVRNANTPVRMQVQSQSQSHSQSKVQDQNKIARLDRKVMDLEISNGSLLAVNKYLEKKLRSKERKLMSMKEHGRGYYGAYGDEDEEDDEEEEDENEDVNKLSLRELLISNNENDELDPSQIDEKTTVIQDRMNDHIAFFETSQKIDKSIHKCLEMAGALLESANSALAYTVDPKDVRLGGKVVHNDDDDDDDDEESNDNDNDDDDDVYDSNENNDN